MKKFLFLLLIGCSKDPVNPIPTPVVKDTFECPNAEKHINSLCLADSEKNDYCCKIVNPTKKNKSFTEFCFELQNKGVFLNPKCLSNIKNCEDIDRCTHSSN